MTKFKHAKYRPDEVNYYARMVADNTAMTVFLLFNIDMEMVGMCNAAPNLEWLFDVKLSAYEFIHVMLDRMAYLEKGN